MVGIRGRVKMQVGFRVYVVIIRIRVEIWARLRVLGQTKLLQLE